MYYNPQLGLDVTQGVRTPEKLNSCLRYSNYNSNIDQVKLRQEAFIFGSELGSILVIPISDDALSSAIASSITSLNAEIRWGARAVYVFLLALCTVGTFLMHYYSPPRLVYQ